MCNLEVTCVFTGHIVINLHFDLYGPVHIRNEITHSFNTAYRIHTKGLKQNNENYCLLGCCAV
jgi:hypothetical protein